MRLVTAVCDDIVVCVDGTKDSDRAVIWAAEQADLEGRRLVTLVMGRQRGTRLSRPGALDVPEPYVRNVVGKRATIAEAAAVRAERHRPGLRVAALVTDADPRPALVDASRGARLIVLSACGSGALRTVVRGSVRTAVARGAECPVVVTRPHRPAVGSSGVLVGTDGTERSRPVIEFALRMASLRDLPLTVMMTNGELPSVVDLTDRHPDVRFVDRVGLGDIRQVLRRDRHQWNLIVMTRRQGPPLMEAFGGVPAPDDLSSRAR